MNVAERGRHFDPDVVDAFVDCQAQLNAVALRCADDARTSPDGLGSAEHRCP